MNTKKNFRTTNDSNEKVINYKVLVLIEVYNYCFGHFSIELCLYNLKFEF